MAAHLLTPSAPLTLSALAGLLASGDAVALAPEAVGFTAPEGPAPAAELAALRAHACGTGPEVPQPLVRLMLLLAAQQAVQQPAGLARATAERLLACYNRELLPVVFEQGGDAAARAHLALPLLGEGEVNYQGYRLATADALSLFSWAPLALRPGEAGALLGRGTPLALAYAADAVLRARHLAPALAAIRALAAPAAGAPAALGALAPAAAALDAALRAPVGAALAPALGALAADLVALGQAAAAAAQQAEGLGHAANGLAAHGLVISRFMASEAAAYAAGHLHQLVGNTEQLLGMALLAADSAPETAPAAALRAAFRAAVPAGGPGAAPYPALRQAAAFVRRHAWAGA